MQPLQQDRDNQELVPPPVTPPAEPDPPSDATDEQLADFLEECLRAERALPGSSLAIIQSAPEQLRPDLEQLLALGQALRASSVRHVSPSNDSDTRASTCLESSPPRLACG